MEQTCTLIYIHIKEKINEYQKLINLSYKQKENQKKYKHLFLLKIHDIIEKHKIPCRCHICLAILDIRYILMPYIYMNPDIDKISDKVTDVYNTITCIFYKIHNQNNS